MARSAKEVNSFIVRLWNEGSADRGEEALWRGSIKHVQSGKKQYFQGFAKMVELMQKQIEQEQGKSVYAQVKRRQRPNLEKE